MNYLNSIEQGMESRSLLMQKTKTKAKHCQLTKLFTYTNRYGMNEMNKFSSMGMIRMEETCKDKISAKKCSKLKKKGKCSDKKVAKKCKKTCELCDDGQGKIFRYNPSCVMSLGGFPVSLPRGNWVKCDKKYIYQCVP